MSGVNSTDKLIYEAIKVGLILIPASLGAFMFISACIGYGKPPVKWPIRSVVGCVGLLLLFWGIHGALLSK
jgi:lipopolysaccharide export LptBFGC system permease protein LptF